MKVLMKSVKGLPVSVPLMDSEFFQDFSGASGISKGAVLLLDLRPDIKGGAIMFHKKFLAFLAVLTVISLLFTACGSKKTEDTPGTESATEVLNLSEWGLSSSTWSSPNGATVHLVATPAGYVKGQSASFVVRLEGEDVESVPCEWDGTHYTASADLNGEDGYCYYVLMTGSTGETAEVPVNVPNAPVDENLINLASSLESSCSLVISSSSYDGKWLSITNGALDIRPPRITNDGEPITCTKAVLTLLLDGQESSESQLELPNPAEDGSYALQLSDFAIQTPKMEDDQQLSIRLDVTLSNDQTLTASGGTWFYIDGNLMMSVG